MTPRLFGKFELILACSVIISAIFISFFIPYLRINKLTNHQINQTDTWQTFTKIDYRFNPLTSPQGNSIYSPYKYSVKYPPDWIVRKDSVDFLPPGKSENDTISDSISIYIKNSLIFPPQNSGSTFKPFDSIYANQQKINIYKETFNLGNQDHINYVAIIFRGNYLISISTSDALYRQYPSLFNLMVQNFHFTLNQPDNSSLWKTFYNEKLKFSFLYPPDVTVTILPNSENLALSNQLSEFMVIENPKTRTSTPNNSYCTPNNFTNSTSCNKITLDTGSVFIDQCPHDNPFACDPPSAEIYDKSGQIVVTASLTSGEAEISLFELILSTFNF